MHFRFMYHDYESGASGLCEFDVNSEFSVKIFCIRAWFLCFVSTFVGGFVSFMSACLSKPLSLIALDSLSSPCFFCVFL